jgi:hypothetical protein
VPEDLRKQIIEAIAKSGDENYKNLLMLLLRVEEIFLERVDQLSDQLTVPVKLHAEDHAWIAEARKVQGDAKSVFLRLSYSVMEKGIWVAAGVAAARILG